MGNNKAPFNTGVRRFGKITCHPNLDPAGLYVVRPDGCDPCLYDPVPIDNYCDLIHKQSPGKEPWRYKTELEAWSKNLGYKNQRLLIQRKWDLSLRGPAWHEIPEPKKYLPVCMNISFGRTSRTIRSKNNIPAPGTYHQAVPFKAPNGPHSIVPSFEMTVPCRFMDTTPKWHLAPNRYKILDKECIAEKSKKIVSLKGPYQLFTGKRDDSTIKNHFNRSGRTTSSTWPYPVTKDSFDTYKKSHLGKMNKTGRDKPHRGRLTLVDTNMCIKKPKEPGPTTYTVLPPREFVQNKRPFNSTYDKPPGYVRMIVWPGVGRYRFVRPTRIKGQGHKSVFLSKLQRTIGGIIPAPMNSF